MRGLGLGELWRKDKGLLGPVSLVFSHLQVNVKSGDREHLLFESSQGNANVAIRYSKEARQNEANIYFYITHQRPESYDTNPPREFEKIRDSLLDYLEKNRGELVIAFYLGHDRLERFTRLLRKAERRESNWSGIRL